VILLLCVGLSPDTCFLPHSPPLVLRRLAAVFVTRGGFKHFDQPWPIAFVPHILPSTSLIFLVYMFVHLPYFFFSPFFASDDPWAEFLCHFAPAVDNDSVPLCFSLQYACSPLSDSSDSPCSLLTRVCCLHTIYLWGCCGAKSALTAFYARQFRHTPLSFLWGYLYALLCRNLAFFPFYLFPSPVLANSDPQGGSFYKSLCIAVLFAHDGAHLLFPFPISRLIRNRRFSLGEGSGIQDRKKVLHKYRDALRLLDLSLNSSFSLLLFLLWHLYPPPSIPSPPPTLRLYCFTNFSFL